MSDIAIDPFGDEAMALPEIQRHRPIAAKRAVREMEQEKSRARDNGAYPGKQRLKLIVRKARKPRRDLNEGQ